MNLSNFIVPNWPAPSTVKAYTSTRSSMGNSLPPYDAFNLSLTVGDSLIAVTANRTLLAQTLQLPSEPIWLNQVHGTNTVPATPAYALAKADAAYSSTVNQVCTVLTADCLPILMCNQQGTRVAAVHAGWRGLAQGVITQAVQALDVPAHTLMAWLGPALSQRHFEVGEDVYAAFVDRDQQAAHAFYPALRPGHWQADLYALATLALHRLSVNAVYRSNYCTYADQALFYSYRRDQGTTGRMASLIWLTQPTH